MNSKILIVLYIFIFCNLGCANHSYQFSDEPIVYLYVDKIPRFSYGDGLKSFIYSNLRWPNKFDGEGKVVVSFVINKSGSVENIKIVKSLCEDCDREVIRIVNLMPKWEPGELKNKTVDVIIYLPIYFSIKK